MKTLYLIRHAKSDWTEINQRDIDRPLNDRGKRNAPIMANRLVKRNVKLDLFVSSPATRAMETCRIFCSAFGYNVNNILIISNLYQGSIDNYEAAIVNLSDKFNEVALFGHNPGITYFSHKLLEDAYIDNFPTCGICAIESPCVSWKDFMRAPKHFLFFDYPKSNPD